MVAHKNNLRFLFCLLAIVFLSGLFNLTIVNADVLDVENNKKRISEILKILDKEYELSSLPLGNDDLCWSLFHDMQAGKNIEYISPVDEAESYEDLGWNNYLPKCNNKNYGVSYEINHKFIEIIKKYPESEWGKFGKKLFYTRNFKLYKIDAGQTSNNREVIVFYAEKRELEEPPTTGISIPGNGGFKLISPDSCEVIGGMSTYDPYDYFRKTPLENYNGVIRYKGKIYTYDLWHSKFQSHQYSLGIYGFGNNNKFGSFCNIGKNLKKGAK